MRFRAIAAAFLVLAPAFLVLSPEAPLSGPASAEASVSVLLSLDAAYKMNARGPDTGDITCEFEDEFSAVLEWDTWGPCALNVGIIQGCCSRFGAHALVEHGATGCMDEGARSCVYRVSW